MEPKHYESVVIFNAALEDEQIENNISRIQETIKHNGGKVTELDRWGRKRLAYPIEKSKTGYYLILRYAAPAELIAVLERSFRLDETVIRYLTIVLNKKALEGIAKQKEAERIAKENAAQEAAAETSEKSAAQESK
jgi:small subunit ribosomal protein S6